MTDLQKDLQDQLSIVFDVMGSDKFTDSVATFCWNLYTKLKLKGFTDDQAIKLVTGLSKGTK